MSAVLCLLERTLADDNLASDADLYQAIMECLRLEETHSAFAVGLGMVDTSSQSSSSAKTPSVDDIDLF